MYKQLLLNKFNSIGGQQRPPPSGEQLIEEEREDDEYDYIKDEKRVGELPETNFGNLYFNVEKYNPPTLGGNKLPVIAQQSITQSEPLLDQPSLYKLAIIRFSIPANIPLLIWPEDDIAESLYKIQIVDVLNNIEVTKSLIYIEYCTQCLYTRGIYFYFEVLEMINNAFVEAYNEMISINPTYEPLSPPIIQYDPVTTLFNLIVDTKYLTSNSRYLINCSAELITNFLPSFVNSASFNVIDRLPVTFIVNDRLGYFVTVSGIQKFSVQNETTCVAIWNQFQKILIMTNSIPVSPEVISSSDNLRMSVLTDFEPDAGLTNTTTPFQYSCQGFIRWVNLNSNFPLSSIQLSILIQYRSGQQFPLYLQSGENFTIKMLIRKKKSWLTN